MIDFPDLAYSRVYNQYRADPDTVAWYNITPTLATEIQTAFEAVRNSYSIDDNCGAQLDVIGRLIDINRSVVGRDEMPVYQLNNEDAECGNDDIQCSVEYIADDVDLDDEYFKPLLKAKVAKNTSDATIDSIILATQIIMSSDSQVRLRDNEDMTFTIEIYTGIADIERSLLQKGIIPTPQGVRLRGVLDGIGIAECGDESMECGNESAECIGLIEVN